MLEDRDALDVLAASCQAAFPDLAVETITYLAEGFHSRAYCVNDRYVLRVGQTDEAMDGYQREAAIMPYIARVLPFAVPLPRHAVDQDVSYCLHEMVHGVDVHHFNDDPHFNDAKLAKDLADFMTMLHKVAIPDDQTRHLKVTDLRTEFPYERIMRSARHLGTEKIAEHYYALYQEKIAQCEIRPFVLTHGDFNHCNMLVDENTGRLVGAIDFGEIGMQPIEVDFAPLIKSHPFLTLAVADHYAAKTGYMPDMQCAWLQAWLCAYHGLADALDAENEKRIKHNMKRLSVLALLPQFDTAHGIGI